MFVVQSFGDYEIVMTLAGKNYSRTFKVRQQA